MVSLFGLDRLVLLQYTPEYTSTPVLWTCLLLPRSNHAYTQHTAPQTAESELASTSRNKPEVVLQFAGVGFPRYYMSRFGAVPYRTLVGIQQGFSSHILLAMEVGSGGYSSGANTQGIASSKRTASTPA